MVRKRKKENVEAGEDEVEVGWRVTDAEEEQKEYKLGKKKARKKESEYHA